jgi:hypothetical protein
MIGSHGMADQIVIENLSLAKQIQQIAKQEHRSVEEVLLSMVTQYRSPSIAEESSDADEMARHVHLVAYQQARDYWEKAGNAERAGMTDEQLDRTFWLFDADGIPRLKEDQDKVKLPVSSLHHAGQVLRSADFHSGQSDISARSREILDDEFAEYLIARRDKSTNNDSSAG